MMVPVVIKSMKKETVTAVAWTLVFATLLSVLYSEVGYRLVLQWYRDADYSHGFLIPLLSAYFVWERREKLVELPVCPSLWGILLLGIGLLILLVGSIGAELYLQRSSFIFVIAGLVLLVLGVGHLRALMFPIAFLLLMVPLPTIVMNTVAFPLQMFAARAATFSLFCLGIPVLREGNVIVLAHTSLDIAEACSGLRSLQALLTLGVVYAYFTERTWWKQCLLVFLSVPIAIAANAFRVSGTGILAQFWGLEAAEGFYHTFSGLLIFVVAFSLLLFCGTLLSTIARRSIPKLTEGVPS